MEVREFVGLKDHKARLKLEARRGAKPLVIVLLGLALALAIGAYIVSNVSRTVFAKTREVSFAVNDATAVVKGANEVRLRGISAGTITKVEIRDGRAVLTAKVQKKYGDIYANARAELRPNTALQDMYLNITDRGSKDAGSLEDRGPLPASQTETSTNINDVLGVFNAPVRVRLRTLLDQLGNGLDDRGARLRTAFEQTIPFVADATRISEQLAARKPLVQRLVRNTATLTRTLAERQSSLDHLLDSGSKTLAQLSDSRGDLGATLDALPPTLGAVDSSFAAVSDVLPAVDGALNALTPVARKLPDALADVRRLNASAAPAVRKLQEPVTELVPLSKSLRPVSRDLAATVDALQPQVPVVDKVTDGLVRCEKGYIGFFQWNASIGKFGDDRGPYPRGNLVAGAQSSGVLNDPNEYFPKSCAPGRPIAGRPADPEKDGR